MPTKRRVTAKAVHNYLSFLRTEAQVVSDSFHLKNNGKGVLTSTFKTQQSRNSTPVKTKQSNRKNTPLAEHSTHESESESEKRKNNLKGSSHSILIFDQDHLRVKGLQKAFEDDGYLVTVAKDYEAADGYCHAIDCFRLLVLNLEGPKFPAVQLMQSIIPSKIPVILTTWEEMNKEVQHHIDTCIGMGISSCFQNVTSYDAIIQRARQLVQRFSRLEEVFSDIQKYSDPDYAANKAKEHLLAVETNSSVNLGRIEKRSTLDEHGATMNVAKSRLLMAIHRSRQGVQAAARVRTTLVRQSVKDTQARGTAMDRRFSLSKLRPKRGFAKFPDDDPSMSLPRVFTDPLRFASLPWEEVPDEYLERLGFPKDVNSPLVPEISQPKMREVVPVHGKSSSEHKFLIQGLKLRQAGNMQGAILQYNRALQGNADFWPIYLCRGVALHLAGSPKEAFIDFTRCICLNHECSDAYYNRALLLYSIKENQGAINDLTAAIHICPNDPQLLSSRGYIHRRNMQFLEAKADYIESEVIKAEQLETKSRGSVRKRHQRLSNIWKNSSFGHDQSQGSKDGLRSGSVDSDSLSMPSGYESSDSESSDNSVLSGSLSDWDKTEGTNGQNLLEGRSVTETHGRVDLEEYRNANNLGENVYAQIFQQKTALEIAFGKPNGRRNRKDLEEISNLLKTIPMFQRIPNSLVRRTAEVAKSHSCLKGMCVMQQDAEAHSFFIIVSGVVHVMCKVPGSDSEQFITAMAGGSYFGETAILNNTKRKASVVCAQECFMVYIAKQDFLRLNLAEFLEREIEEKKAMLRRFGLFEDITEDELHEISKVACFKTYERNSVILRQGDVPKYFVILISGLCKVLQFSDTVADLGRREMELLEDLNRFDMAYVYHHCLHDDEVRELAVVTQESEEAQLRAKGFRLNSPTREGAKKGSGKKRERAATVLKQNLERELADVRQRLVQLRKHHHVNTIAGSKLVEVGTAYPPNVFGEVAVLDPFKGRERGTVIAQSYVRVIMINKGQIGSFQNNSKFLERVRAKSFNFLSHLEVKRELQEKEMWKNYRVKTMRQIEKKRWPISKTRIRHLITGSGDTEIIPESEMPGSKKGL